MRFIGNMCVQRSSKSASSSSYASLNSSRGSAVLTNSGSAGGTLTNSGSANGAVGCSAMDCSSSSVCEICYLALPKSVCHVIYFSSAELFRWNRSSASNSAYSYTFLHSVVCLSVICLSHLCPCFNHSMDIHCESKKGTSILLPITLSDVDGFSKFFHC